MPKSRIRAQLNEEQLLVPEGPCLDSTLSRADVKETKVKGGWGGIRSPPPMVGQPPNDLTCHRGDVREPGEGMFFTFPLPRGEHGLAPDGLYQQPDPGERG